VRRARGGECPGGKASMQASSGLLAPPAAKPSASDKYVAGRGSDLRSSQHANIRRAGQPDNSLGLILICRGNLFAPASHRRVAYRQEVRSGPSAVVIAVFRSSSSDYSGTGCVGFSSCLRAFREEA